MGLLKELMLAFDDANTAENIRTAAESLHKELKKLHHDAELQEHLRMTLAQKDKHLKAMQQKIRKVLRKRYETVFDDSQADDSQGNTPFPAANLNDSQVSGDTVY